MTTRNVPRLLLVEDDFDTAELVCETLTDHFGVECTLHVDNITDAQALDLQQFDLVICDVNLPDGSGLELLPLMLAQRSDIPVVMATSEAGMDTAMKAIRLGAYDYVVKIGDYMFTIPLVIEKNLEVWKIKHENLYLQKQLENTLEQVSIKNDQLEQLVQQLEALASTDPLTGLSNRRSVGEALEQNFAESARYGNDLAVLMIDLDGFKGINDTLGHQMGDKILQTTARILLANCRRADVAGRYGGDEFIVLMPQTSPKLAHQVAQRIQKEFNNAIKLMLKSQPQCAMSMGLANVSATHPAHAEQLIGMADAALYQAKEAGKARIFIYQPNDDAAMNNPNNTTDNITDNNSSATQPNSIKPQPPKS